MELMTCGHDAVLVELPGRDAVLRMRDAMRRARPDGLLELIPATRTLLVRYDPRRLGPARLRALLAGMPVDAPDAAAPAEIAPRPGFPPVPVLRVTPGPCRHWFADDALARLYDPNGYRVSPRSDRVGMRLDGPELARARTGELPPEAAVPGALQVPPAGRPVLYLADHPVTGGHPVIAVVHPDDLPLAARTPPGHRLRFRPQNIPSTSRQER